MPGTHLPVGGAGAGARTSSPTYLLVLAWNFFDEIAKQLDGVPSGGREVRAARPRAAIR